MLNGFGHFAEKLLEELLAPAFRLREIVLDLSARSGIERTVEVRRRLDAVRIGNRFSRWSSDCTGRLNRSSGVLHFAISIGIVTLMGNCIFGTGRCGP